MLKRTHEPVTRDALSSLPFRRDARLELACTPERLFASFGDVAELKRWLDLDVTWLDEVREPGIRRTIREFPLDATEFFTHFDPPHGLSFYFESSNLLIVRAFAEDWQITPTDGGCVFDWSFGLRMSRGFGWLGPTLAGRVAAKVEGGFGELTRIVERGT